jgi:hypothetical protein
MDYNYIISELNVMNANLERLKRGVEQERDAEKVQPQGDYALAAPSNVEYDRSRLEQQPRAVQPQNGEVVKCNCGLPAEFKKSAPQNPKQWAAWFCARPKGDPKNCGFRKWLD